MREVHDVASLFRRIDNDLPVTLEEPVRSLGCRSLIKSSARCRREKGERERGECRVSRSRAWIYSWTGNLTIFRAVVKNDGRDERETLEEPLRKRFRWFRAPATTNLVYSIKAIGSTVSPPLLHLRVFYGYSTDIRFLSTSLMRSSERRANSPKHDNNS